MVWCGRLLFVRKSGGSVCDGNSFPASNVPAVPAGDLPHSRLARKNEEGGGERPRRFSARSLFFCLFLRCLLVSVPFSDPFDVHLVRPSNILQNLLFMMTLNQRS